MKIRGHHNHRHDNQQKITFPRFITRCHFSCLRHYADSDASSDLQQESLLENQAEHHHSHDHDICQMSSSDWGYQGNSLQNRLDRDAMEDASDNEEANQTPSTSEACAEQMTRNSSVLATAQPTNPRVTARRQNNTRNADSELDDSWPDGSRSFSYQACVPQLANNNHFQMPKFNSRMWQDGFGRFRRDTIPRRDNTSPVSSHQDSVNRNSNTGPSWFFNPVLRGLQPMANQRLVRMKEPSPMLSNEMVDNDDFNMYGSRGGALQDDGEELMDDTDECSTFQNLADFSAAAAAAAAGRADVDEARSGRGGGRLMLHGRSSNLAEVLQSLPQQPRDSPYGDVNQSNSRDAAAQSREDEGSQNQSHTSLYEIMDQIQQRVQDNSPTAHAQSEVNTTCRGRDGADGQLSRSGSSRSSTWSNSALIHQLLQALTTGSPHGTVSPRSLTSTQSSGSNANQPNWYYYDRRLVPSRNTGATDSIPQPPSYEEALAAFGGMAGDGRNMPNDVTPNEPPPPYPGSDASPPPSYDSMASSRTDSNLEESRFDAEIRRFYHPVTCADERVHPQEISSTFDSGLPIESAPRQNVYDNDDDNYHEARITGSPGNASRDADPEPNERRLHDQQRLNLLGLSGRPPVRWNRGMRFERWASTHNWATEPVL